MVVNDSINGTDLLGLGTFKINISGNDIDIYFYPSDEEKKCCEEIKFIQIVKTEFYWWITDALYGHDWIVDGATSTYDINGNNYNPYYPYQDSYKSTGKGFSGDRATMEDRPGGQMRQSSTFETCAICLSNCPDWSGKNLGCVKWTLDTDENKNPTFGGDATGKYKDIQPSQPSNDFNNTVERYKQSCQDIQLLGDMSFGGI
jgi:hypothetical protein